MAVEISQVIGQYNTLHELIAAASIIASVPVFLFHHVLQRKFGKGVIIDALKG